MKGFDCSREKGDTWGENEAKMTQNDTKRPLVAVRRDGIWMDTAKEGEETYGKKIGRECDKKRIKSKKEKERQTDREEEEVQKGLEESICAS